MVGRYIVLSRLWLLALLALVVVLLWMGQYTLVLLGLAAGYAGFVFVFDSRRSWWGSEVRDFVADSRSRPSDTRPLVLFLVMVAVTVIVGVVILR